MILSNHSSGQEVRDTPRPERVAVFYFGNSFLENSVPWFHPTLAATAGKQLKVATAIGPGWQIWMHVDAMRRNPDGHPRKTLASGDWNAVLIQHFGTHPGLNNNVRKSVFLNQEFDEPRDVSDLASAAEIIDLLLASAKNPDQARVFIYSSWPGMPGVAELSKRLREEVEKSLESAGQPREEILKRLREHKPTPEEMDPLVREFDYSAHWLADYEWNPEVPWESKNAHSRDYVTRLMDALRAKYPDLARTGRLRLIPNGAVFLALDRKARGGEHPGGLDPAIYNDKENYRNERLPQPGYVHWPDLGELIEITPERKKIVDDAVWEIVRNHPHIQVK
jgi:hypothetical protein